MKETKFIEVTRASDGEKFMINLDTVSRVVSYENETRLYCRHDIITIKSTYAEFRLHLLNRGFFSD